MVSESTGPAEPTTTPAKPSDGGAPVTEPKPAKSPKPAKVKKPATPEQLERRKAAIRFTVFVAVGAVLTVLLYFLLSAFIPRWWSQAVGRQAGGRISGGIVIGLLYGFIFTFLPLIVLAQARHRAFSWPAKAIIVLVAAALTAPNLMTLGIAIGNGAAARAGNRTLDVMAPGFRQATLWGVRARRDRRDRRGRVLTALGSSESRAQAAAGPGGPAAEGPPAGPPRVDRATEGLTRYACRRRRLGSEP